MSDSVIRIVNARQHNLRASPSSCPTGRSSSITGSVRLRQELARLRHPLRRGTAALHRVAVHLRQAVPRPDAQAAGGPARGAGARRWPSSSGIRRSRAAPRSARRPRSTTTCGCSGPGSGGAICRDVRRAGAAGHPAVRRGRHPAPAAGPASDLLPAAAGRPAHPRGGRRESARARASCACWPRRAAPPRRAARRTSTSPERTSCWWWWTASTPTPARPAGSPRRWPPHSRKAKASPSPLRDARAPPLHPVPRLQRVRYPGAPR